MFGDSERLLVLHDGRLLIRLDPATGSKRWSCLLGFEDLSERPGAMAYDDKRFYCVNTENIYGGLAAGGPGRLAGRRLARLVVSPVRAQGTERPVIAWSIALTQRYVIAYPGNNAPASEPVDKLPVIVMPVIVRQRETGELVQRFVFPTTIADVTFKADPHGGLGGDGAGPLGTGLEGGELVAACPTAGIRRLANGAAWRGPAHDEDDCDFH